jgi:MFS transporter, ACS family, aldohexuronate transporter
VSTPRTTRYARIVLALLFFATTINYLDRIALGVLLPLIRTELHLTDQEYGNVTGAFQIAYTIGFLIAGKFIDRFGTRIGYAVAIFWWSLAAGFHGLARSTMSLAFWRGMLGLGEAGNFPAAIKAVAEWFPEKDRAFATGIFNAGTNVASMIGPPVFVWLSLRYGWRSCFLLTGALGFVWLAAWMAIYREPASAAERKISAAGQIGWLDALKSRQTWGFALGKFLTDPVWWFYLYWLPPYLYDVRKFDLKEVGWALPVVYLVADFGSVGGGWLSGHLIRRGWTTIRARRGAMTVCALCMPVAAMAVFAPGPALAIALIALANSAHQGWSANLFTLASDMFPPQAVGSVVGLGGFAGAVGGMLIAKVTGYVLQMTGSYTTVLLIAGAAYLVALAVVQILTPRLEAARVANN